MELVKKLGADHVIDKSKQDLWKEVERIFPNGVHHIYDANGVQPLLVTRFGGEKNLIMIQLGWNFATIV